jgi:uncharacterized protein YbaA (DUF1428 family)
MSKYVDGFVLVVQKIKLKSIKKWLRVAEIRG